MYKKHQQMIKKMYKIKQELKKKKIWKKSEKIYIKETEKNSDFLY